MLKSVLMGLLRQLRLLTVLAGITVVTGTLWSYLGGIGDEAADATVAAAAPGAAADRAAQAWGDEILAGIHEHVVAGLPIRVANACGLGASSCFRCHNGKRAAEPGNDPVKDPWHVHHKSVNNSCVGCHQGNPRLMKQDIAHKDLVVNPRTTPATSCFTCHTSADAQGLVDVYLKLSNTTGE